MLGVQLTSKVKGHAESYRNRPSNLRFYFGVVLIHVSTQPFDVCQSKPNREYPCCKNTTPKVHVKSNTSGLAR